MILLYDKKFIRFIAFCMAFFVAVALFFFFKSNDESLWFVKWFSDKFYTFIICSIYLLGISIIDKYFNYFTFNRIGNRKKYLICQLIQQYSFAFILMNMIFVSIIVGALFKYSKLETSILVLINWYFKYLLGLIMIANLCMIFQKSKIRVLASFSYLWAFLILSLELLAIVPKLKMLYSINIKIMFSWIFFQNTAISYIILLAINTLMITYLIGIVSRKDLFI